MLCHLSGGGRELTTVAKDAFGLFLEVRRDEGAHKVVDKGDDEDEEEEDLGLHTE